MRPFPIIAFLFIAVPIIEIYFLVKVGEQIGPLKTILLVIITAIIGTWLLRQQGLSTLARFQSSMASGKIPAQEMIEGVILLIGGILLLTPGFVTDALGLLCLLPFSRQAFARKIAKNSSVHLQTQMGGFGSQRPNQQNQSGNGDIYEGEYTQKEDDKLDRW